jgi:CRP-like cAMP-binding protein
LNAIELLAKRPLSAELAEEQLGALAQRLNPIFAVPGKRLIRRDDPGNPIYFIASGAVEVSILEHKIRLGRGDFVGEIALHTGRSRKSDVYAIDYCFLFRLDVSDFESFLAQHPNIRLHIEDVAGQQLATNRETMCSSHLQRHVPKQRKHLLVRAALDPPGHPRRPGCGWRERLEHGPSEEPAHQPYKVSNRG